MFFYVFRVNRTYELEAGATDLGKPKNLVILKELDFDIERSQMRKLHDEP